MKITLSTKSKIGNVDFENLEFGKVFTDHIFVSKYSNGQWSEGEIMPYGDFLISPSARVFHYCLLYTSPSPRDSSESRMPSSA